MIAGIDVSHYQGEIHWPTVATHGVRFAYAKATEGDTIADWCFALNYRNMKEANVLRGAYHLLHPATPDLPVARQAAHFLAVVPPPTAGDLPPMLDIEPAAANGCLPAAADVLAWLDKVGEAWGLMPILYCDGAVWTALHHEAPRIATYPYWVAEQPVLIHAPAPELPAGQTDWVFWQHCDQRGQPGFPASTTVDLDWFNGSIDQLRQLAGLSPPSST